MAQCEMCGNEYDKTFDVVMNGQSHTFDSFECAIHALAPICEHCGCKVIGHGVEAAAMMIGAPSHHQTPTIRKAAATKKVAGRRRENERLYQPDRRRFVYSRDFQNQTARRYRLPRRFKN